MNCRVFLMALASFLADSGFFSSQPEVAYRLDDGHASVPKTSLRPSGWLEKNPESAKKLASAIKKTLQFIADHSGEEIAAEMPEAFAGGDPEQYAKVIEEMKVALSKDGAFTEEGVKAVLETQRVANPEVGEAEIKLEETYTNEFVK